MFIVEGTALSRTESTPPEQQEAGDGAGLSEPGSKGLGSAVRAQPSPCRQQGKVIHRGASEHFWNDRPGIAQSSRTHLLSEARRFVAIEFAARCGRRANTQQLLSCEKNCSHEIKTPFLVALSVWEFDAPSRLSSKGQPALLETARCCHLPSLRHSRWQGTWKGLSNNPKARCRSQV